MSGAIGSSGLPSRLTRLNGDIGSLHNHIAAKLNARVSSHRLMLVLIL